MFRAIASHFSDLPALSQRKGNPAYQEDLFLFTVAQVPTGAARSMIRGWRDAGRLSAEQEKFLRTLLDMRPEEQ